MGQTNITQDALKKAMKDALVEALNEQRGLFRDVFAEALDDIALIEAIKEGEKSKKVSREQIFRTLKSGQQ